MSSHVSRTEIPLNDLINSSNDKKTIKNISKDTKKDNLIENSENINPNIKNPLVEKEINPDKFFEKYKDCDCCKGFIYKCPGKACFNMGVCHCRMTDEEFEDEI